MLSALLDRSSFPLRSFRLWGESISLRGLDFVGLDLVVHGSGVFRGSAGLSFGSSVFRGFEGLSFGSSVFRGFDGLSSGSSVFRSFDGLSCGSSVFRSFDGLSCGFASGALSFTICGGPIVGAGRVSASCIGIPEVGDKPITPNPRPLSNDTGFRTVGGLHPSPTLPACPPAANRPPLEAVTGAPGSTSCHELHLYRLSMQEASQPLTCSRSPSWHRCRWHRRSRMVLVQPGLHLGDALARCLRQATMKGTCSAAG